MNQIRRPWLPRTKLTVSLLLLALFVYLIPRFSVVIPPLIFAVIIAFVLTPFVDRLDRRLPLPRWVITLLVYLLALALLVLIPIIFVPPLAEQITKINLDFQLILAQLEDLFAHQYVVAGQIIDGAEIFSQAVAVIQESLQPLFGHTLGFAFDVIESLVWIVFVFVISFYLIKDNAAVMEWMDRLPPKDLREDARRLRYEINQIWGAFFRGQLILAIVVAILITIMGFSIGLPFALAMGVYAGLMEFIPSVGHAIWLTTASILALFAGSAWMDVPNWVFALVLVGLHVVFQQFDLNYLIPRIIGRQVHLPPLVVILGIVAGAAIAGVLGVVLAAPTVASARVLSRYVFANLNDTDPFPEEITITLPPPDPRWWDMRRKTADGHKDGDE